PGFKPAFDCVASEGMAEIVKPFPFGGVAKHQRAYQLERVFERARIEPMAIGSNEKCLLLGWPSNSFPQFWHSRCICSLEFRFLFFSKYLHSSLQYMRFPTGSESPPKIFPQTGHFRRTYLSGLRFALRCARLHSGLQYFRLESQTNVFPHCWHIRLLSLTFFTSQFIISR
ncbi:MAG: hypothetical protein FWC27_14080, partial [Firmicutes bacterium]|nr:hypothetical protein [Bacillota bacterium]